MSKINPDILIPHHFEAREYQIPFLHAVEESLAGRSPIRFFYQVWHRRSGKDKTNIADVVPRRLIKDPCLVKYVYPTLTMARENMWDGIGGDGYKYLNHIPDDVRLGKPNETRMSMRVWNEQYSDGDDNHSIFRIGGSDNPDSIRGGNTKLFVFSEWADQDPRTWDVAEPILRENGGIAVFNTTPKGDNHARALLEYAKNNPLWYVSMLNATQTGVFTASELEAIKQDIVMRWAADGRSEEEAIAYFEQEYMCSFESPVVGSYYGAALRKAEQSGRVGKVPYEATLPVHTAWDLGMDDSMTIWFYQTVGPEIRIIDYYENSGEGIEFYVKVLQDRKYIYGKHYGPHDIQVRELGTGKSRWEVAKTLGVRFETVANIGVDEGINAARSIFAHCYFDAVKCNRGIQCLKNYKKAWNEKLKVFSNTPLHNWASHGADGFRILAVGYKRPTATSQPPVTGFGGAGWN